MPIGILEGAGAALAAKLLIHYADPAASAQVAAKSQINPASGPPHLRRGARLLSDEEIVAEVAATGFSSAHEKDQLRKALACECLSFAGYAFCKGAPPTVHASIKTLQDGSLGLSIAGSTGLISGVAAPFSSAGLIGGSFTAGSLLGAATFGIGAAVGVFAILHAHHAAAVAREQSTECQFVPPANDSLQVIEAAVLQRRIKPQMGQQLLAQLYNEFTAAVKPLRKNCNSFCYWEHYLHGIILKKQNRYAQLI